MRGHLEGFGHGSVKHTIKQWGRCLSMTDEPSGLGFFVRDHPGSGPSPQAIDEFGELIIHEFSWICLCLRVTSTAVHNSTEKGTIIFLVSICNYNPKFLIR